MDWFNQVIQEIKSKGLTPTLAKKEIGSELYRIGADDLLSRFYLKRRTPPEITLYYPISYTDVFPPLPIKYAGGRVAPKDLLESIWSFYRTPLQPENLGAYLQSTPGLYDFLRGHANPILLDIMLDRIYIQGLVPYQDGYLVNVTD